MFITVFFLGVVMTYEVSAASPESIGSEADFSLLPHLPMFSAELSPDVELFLGQKRRRHGGGGRVWANAYYGDTTLKPKEGGKIEPSLYGFQIGFDVIKSHGTFSTFFFNINQSKVKFGEHFGGGASTVDNYLLGYGKFTYFSLCHFAFTGSVGYDRYEVSRGNTNTGDGLQINLFGEFGLDFIIANWAIKPFYALQYDFLYHGSIGGVPTLYSDWDGHGLQQLFGLRLQWKPTHILELQSRATWVHELLNNPPPFYRARFSPMPGISTPVIMFHEGNTGRDWVWLGIGAKLECLFNLSLFLDYDLLLNKQHVTHLGTLGLCLSW